MTQKQATKAEATILYKVTVKRNGITIYHVQGTDRIYYVTLSSRGTISSCADEHDNTCKGFLYNHGACKHAKAVEHREAERTGVKGNLHSSERKLEVCPASGNLVIMR